MRSVFLLIDGMSCEHCVGRARDALLTTLTAVAKGDPEQVSTVEVLLEDHAAKIDLAPAASKIKPAALVAAVERAGKNAVVAHALAVGGMTCEHCVARVQKALSALPHVGRVHVSLSWGGIALVQPTAAFVHASGEAGGEAGGDMEALTAELIDAVEGVGKTAALYGADGDGVGR